MSMTAEQQRQYNDMVNTPVEGLILRKALPSIVSLLVMSVYNLVDTCFVGRLGTSATGAVGIVFPLMNFVHAAGLFFGKGTGTMLGQVLTFVILFWQSTREGCLPIRLKNLSFSLEESMEIWRGGLASLLKNSLSSVAAVLLNTAARPYGDAVIAAFSIVTRLIHVVQQIYFGLGEGFQAVVSYNYGAGQYARVKKGFRFCMKLGLAFIPVAALSWLFGAPVIRAFRDDAEVISSGRIILGLQMSSTALLPICFSGFVMLQGIGKNLHATIVGVGRQGMFLVPLLLLLPRFLGLAGLMAVQPVSDFCAMLLASVVVSRDLKELDRLEALRADPR